jgi:hypothetical protein
MTMAQFFWALITWLTVIVGWMVVADQQNYRELRKDRASRLNDIRDDLLAIEQDAVAFHTADEFSAPTAIALRRALGSLSRELTILGTCNFVEPAWSDSVIALRQACTASNQDANTFKQQDNFSETIGAIMAAKEDLDDLLVASLTEALLSNKPIQQSLRDLWLSTKKNLSQAYRKADEKYQAYLHQSDELD